MKVFLKVVLAVLVFLAISSGITKIMLMEQDTEFFGRYGFTNPLLIAFGISQLAGGCLLIFYRTHLIGASLIAITFLISAGLLVMDGNFVFTLITFVTLFMLGLLVRDNLNGRRRVAD